MLLKLVAFIVLSLCSFVSAKAADSLDDNLIIPGERVGFLTKDITEEKLKALLPANQMKRVLYDVGEGEYHCATEIFPNSQKTVVIIWSSDKTLYEPYKDAEQSQKQCDAVPALTEPKFVEIDSGSTFWKTREGIGIGMNLEELESAHKAPITFSICECDFFGNVINGLNFYVRLNYDNALQSHLEPLITEPDYGVVSSSISSDIKTQITIHEIAIEFPIIYP